MFFCQTGQYGQESIFIRALESVCIIHGDSSTALAQLLSIEEGDTAEAASGVHGLPVLTAVSSGMDY